MTVRVSVDLFGAAPPGLTRAQFLRRAAAAGGAVAGGALVLSGLPRPATAAAPSRQQDIRILNYLLVAEYLQAEFYRRALDGGQLKGELAEFAETVGGHEREHVEYLADVLGDDADGPPDFSFPQGATSGDGFALTALTLEETASAAYIGQGANLTRDRILDAARIVSVEARHAAWMRDILGKVPAPDAADTALSQPEVTRELRRGGFLA
jgi:hypothetical protein